MKKATLTPVKKSRIDRWINEQNTFGAANDPMTRTYYDSGYRLNRPDLDNLYTYNSLAKRIVNIPADDATREWIELTHDTDPGKADFIRDEMKRLKVQAAVHEAIRLGRLYGGNLLVIGAFDGRDVAEPLAAIRQVQFVHNVDRYLAFPQTYYHDPDDVNFGSVETYLVQRLQVQGSISSIVHESRTIRFDGEYMSPITRLRNYGWHAPVLQHVYEELRHYGTANQAGAAVLQDFITKKLKISNLQDLLSSEDGEAQIIARIALMASEMAIHNIAVYGADEEMEKMGTPVTGLPEMIAGAKDVICGACGIPKSRLFQSESGALGGDQGKNDLRIHYDNISAFQENTLRDKIQHIIDLIGAQKGFKPGEVTFTFKPLWQLSESENADVYLKTAQADTAYINSGVLEPEEVALSRFGGDGINLADMNIDVERREEYLEALKKQPIEPDEPGGDPEDPEQGMNPKGQLKAEQ